jgi:predicted ABC-type ATPase
MPYIVSGHNRLEILKNAKKAGLLTKPDSAYIKNQTFPGTQEALDQVINESISTNIKSKSVKDINLLDLYINGRVSEADLKQALAYDQKRIQQFKTIGDTFIDNDLQDFWNQSIGTKLAQYKNIDPAVLQERLNFVSRIGTRLNQVLPSLSEEQQTVVKSTLANKIAEVIQPSKKASLSGIEASINKYLSTIATGGYTAQQLTNLFGETVTEAVVQKSSAVNAVQKAITLEMKAKYLPEYVRTKLQEFSDALKDNPELQKMANEKAGLTVNSAKTQKFIQDYMNDRLEIPVVVPKVIPGALTPYDTEEIIAERKRIALLPATSTITTPERIALRRKVTDELSRLGSYTGKDANGKAVYDGPIQLDKRADIVLGSPASGKSSLMADPLSQEHGSRVIDSDMAKERLGSVNDAPALHVESSDIAESGVYERARVKGENFILPLVGKTSEKIVKLVNFLAEGGYEVHIHFMDIPKDIAAQRAVQRFQHTGRFVDPDYVLNVVGDKPRATYDIIKGNTNLKSYEKFSNDVPKGQKPTLIEQSDYYRSGRGETGQPAPGGRETEAEKISQPTTEKVERPAIPSKETPVGTGRSKNSRLFERIKDTLGAEYEGKEIKYNELSLEKQAQKVVDLVSNDPETAVRVARGYEDAPPGMTQNAVAVALAETARGQEDFSTAADLWTKTSLRSTRLGQEIVSLRGDFSVNEPLNAVKKLLNSRMSQVARRYNDIIKGLAIPEGEPMIKKVDALVKQEAKKVKKLLTKAQVNIQSAQEIINALRCK